MNLFGRIVIVALILGFTTTLFVVGLELIERRYRYPSPMARRRTWEERSMRGQTSALLPSHTTSRGKPG